MNRDEKAARNQDLYVGVGHKSRLCHEDWFTEGEGTGEKILFFSQEQVLSVRPKRFVGRYCGHWLRPISDEDRQKVLERLAFLRIDGLNEAVSIPFSIRMRYTAEEYEALCNRTKEDSGFPVLRTLLGYEMGRFPFTLLILIVLMLSLMLFDLGSEEAVLVAGRPFRSILFYLWTVPLSILNGVLSLHDRRPLTGCVLGWMPCSIHIMGLLLPTYPLVISLVLVAAVLAALFVLGKEYFKMYSPWYSLERARNVLAIILCAACTLVILLDICIPACNHLLA